MEPIKNFDKVNAMGQGSTQLPVGGYVCVIKDVQYKKYDWGDCMYIAWDVAEGELKGFYMKKFKADKENNEDAKWKGVYKLYVPKDDGSEQDEWTKRKLKTFTNALEDSNDGYKWNWDEKKWKNLKFGGVVGEHETFIDGKDSTITFNEVRFVTTVQKIKDGDFRPADKYVDNKAKEFLANNNSAADTGFLSAEEGPDEIPF